MTVTTVTKVTKLTTMNIVHLLTKSLGVTCAIKRRHRRRHCRGRGDTVAIASPSAAASSATTSTTSTPSATVASAVTVTSTLALALVLALTLAFTVQPAFAGSGRAAFERFFNDIDTFQARFGQEVLDENLTTLDGSRGTLWIKRPGKFRWNYDPPEPQQIVGDGERIWLFDVELEQVTVRNQARTLGRTPAMLLAGRGVGDAYRLVDIGRQGGFDWVNLLPADDGGAFTEVRVGFENNRLRLMELIDALGQRTRISFVELKENAPISDARFKFSPPPGVDVIDESAE